MSAFDGIETLPVESTPPAGDAFAGLDAITPQDRILSLANDPSHDPLSHAAQFEPGTPQYKDAVETGFDVTAKRKELGIGPSLGEKAAGAAKGVGKFFMGAGSAIGETGLQYADAIQSGLTDDPEKKRELNALKEKHAANSALQAQTAEMGAAHTGGLIGRGLNWLHDKIYGGQTVDPDTGEVGVDAEYLDQQKNPRKYGVLDFASKVEDARKASSIASGQVQDSGVVANTIKTVTGSKPSEIYQSPEDLASAGAPRTDIDKLSVESGGAAADPSMFAYSAIPAIPGATKLLKGIGVASEGAGNIIPSVISKVKNMSTAGKLATGAGGLEIAREAVAHPKEAAMGLALAATLYGARKFGKFAQESAALAEGAIPAEGMSAAGLRAKQALAGVIPGTLIGGGIGAADDDIAGGAMSGALFGAAGGATAPVRGIQQVASAKAMETHGASLRTGNEAVDAAHDAILSTFTPEQQAAINRRKSALAGDGISLVVTDKSGFDAARASNGESGGENAAGMFAGDDKHIATTNPDGSKTIYLNADAISGKADPGGKVLDVSGHEIGHAVEDYLKKADGGAAAIELQNAVTKALSPKDLKAIQDAYAGDIAKKGGAPVSVDVTGESIAEITRKVLGGEDISNFALPKPLSEKIKDAVTGFFPSMVGDSGGMNWGTKEVTKAKSLIRDALYDQGKRAFELRQRGRDVSEGRATPSIDERLSQIAARQAEIRALPRKDVTTAIHDELRALNTEHARIIDAETERTGIAPSAPVATAAPPSPAIPAPAPITPAPPEPAPAVNPAPNNGPLPWLDPAKAPKTPAVTIDPVVTAPAKPAVDINVEPAKVTAPEINVEPAKKKNEPPAIAVEDPKLSEKRKTAVAELPVDKLPAEGAKKDAPHVPSVAEIKAKIETAKKAGEAQGDLDAEKATKPHTKEAARKAAKTKALTDLLPETGEELHRETDPETGETVFAGRVNPENPIHAAILEADGYNAAHIKNLIKAQDGLGKGVWFNGYKAGKQGGRETGIDLEHTSDRRKEELSASPTSATKGEREGEVTKQDKAVTPYRIILTGKGFNIQTFDHAKFLQNVSKILYAGNRLGEKTGLEGLTGSAKSEAIADAFRKHSENNKNGWKGDGSARLRDFPGNENANLDYVGQPVNPALSDVINMAMHNRSARPPDAPKPLKKTGQPSDSAKARYAEKNSKSQEALGLAAKNDGFINPETGETNRLRDALEKKGFDVDGDLKGVTSNIRPDLIEDGISDKEGGNKTVHTHGFDIAPSELTASGTPRKKQVAAGFMPDVESSSFKTKTRFSPDVEPEKKAQIETPEFKRWSEGLPVISNDNEVPWRGGFVFNGFHGTLKSRGEFNIFEHGKTKGDAFQLSMSDLSPGWFSSSENQASQFGPMIIDAYVKLKKPLVLSGDSIAQSEFADKRAEFRKMDKEFNSDNRPYWSPKDWARFESLKKEIKENKIGVHESDPFAQLVNMAKEAKMEYPESSPGEAVRLALKAQGYDGIVLDGTYADTKASEPKSSHWAIPLDGGSQIKSATGNNGQFDVKNPDIRFSPDVEAGKKKPLDINPDTNALGMYSQLERAVKSKIPNKATPEQILATLNPEKSGVRKDELDTIGLAEFLEGKKSVTKDELLQFIQENGPEIKEVENADKTYAKHALSGGENYKEIGLVMPSVDYRSPHWIRPEWRGNIGHIRQADHVDMDGNKVRLIEEIQSDLHQDGRKQGYASDGIPDGYSVKKFSESHFALLDKNGNIESNYFPSNESERSAESVNSFFRYDQSVKGAPNAPFKKTWQELLMKRAARIAVEDGAEKLAWITGDIAAKRFGKDDASGMQGFYDKIIPDFMRKYVKKWGATVESSDIPQGKGETVKVHAITITPAMRDAVMAGQPLFTPDKKGASSFKTKTMEKPKFGLPGLNVDLPERKDKKGLALDLKP